MTLRQRYVTFGLLGAAFSLGVLVGHGTSLAAQGTNRVFEVRTATSTDAKSRDLLVNRFRQWEVTIFRRIGIQPVAFFVPSDSPRSENTFFYIVAHESRQKAAESWTKVINDPEFKEKSKQGEPIGKVTVDSMFVDPLDFSPIK